MRYQTNRIQSEDLNTGLYRTNKMYLLSYGDQKYRLKDG